MPSQKRSAFAPSTPRIVPREGALTNTSNKMSSGKAEPAGATQSGEQTDARTRLPSCRESLTKTLRIGEMSFYVTVGLYGDGSPGELFITGDYGEGTLRGMLEATAINASIALQYGVPMRAMAYKWQNMRFEPAGFTGDPEFPMVSSVMDYLGRWCLKRFCDEG